MGERIAGPDPHCFVVGHVDCGKVMERSVLGAQLLDNCLCTRTPSDTMPLSQIILGERAPTSARDAGDDDVAAFHTRNCSVLALW